MPDATAAFADAEYDSQATRDALSVRGIDFTSVTETARTVRDAADGRRSWGQPRTNKVA